MPADCVWIFLIASANALVLPCSRKVSVALCAAIRTFISGQRKSINSRTVAGGLLLFSNSRSALMRSSPRPSLTASTTRFHQSSASVLRPSLKSTSPT